MSGTKRDKRTRIVDWRGRPRKRAKPKWKVIRPKPKPVVIVKKVCQWCGVKFDLTRKPGYQTKKCEECRRLNHDEIDVALSTFLREWAEDDEFFLSAKDIAQVIGRSKPYINSIAEQTGVRLINSAAMIQAIYDMATEYESHDRQEDANVLFRQQSDLLAKRATVMAALRVTFTQFEYLRRRTKNAKSRSED